MSTGKSTVQLNNLFQKKIVGKSFQRHFEFFAFIKRVKFGITVFHFLLSCLDKAGLRRKKIMNYA